MKMRKLKVTIELTIKGDLQDPDTMKEDIYQQLQELMEEDDLTYEVVDPHEGEDDEDEEDDYDF